MLNKNMLNMKYRYEYFINKNYIKLTQIISRKNYNLLNILSSTYVVFNCRYVNAIVMVSLHYAFLCISQYFLSITH